MMENVHLAGEEDDDLYSGYNDYNPTFDTEVGPLGVTVVKDLLYTQGDLQKGIYCCVLVL